MGNIILTVEAKLMIRFSDIILLFITAFYTVMSHENPSQVQTRSCYLED